MFILHPGALRAERGHHEISGGGSPSKGPHQFEVLAKSLDDIGSRTVRRPDDESYG